MKKSEVKDSYLIPEVSAELMMDIAKILAHSPFPMDKQNIIMSFPKNKYTPTYITRAITACKQLGMISSINGKYQCADEFRDDLKKCHKSELYLIFRKALQNFAPFLLFIDFLAKGYSAAESASRVKGIFNINTKHEKIEKILKSWGIYAKIINEKDGKIVIEVDTKKLEAEYIKKMLEALKAEINAKIFTIDVLGSRAFAYLDKKKISLSDLARALLNYEKDPRDAAYNACQTFEHFIYKFAEDQDIDTSKFDGIIQLGDELKRKNYISKNHLHLIHGIGGLRIITHHKPDKETGRPWIITPIGSLIAILFTASLIKSIHLFKEEGKQEF